LLWFEEDDPGACPVKTMPAVTTHDFPTVAGLRDGSDLEAHRRLGLHLGRDGFVTIRTRVATATGVDDRARPSEAMNAAYVLLARPPSALHVATLEDAIAGPERPTIRNAAGERRNWSLALSTAPEDVERFPVVTRRAGFLDESVHDHADDGGCS
jgi:4-alpha-glucanotransferase